MRQNVVAHIYGLIKSSHALSSILLFANPILGGDIDQKQNVYSTGSGFQFCLLCTP